MNITIMPGWYYFFGSYGDDHEADMGKIIAMGFEAGFTMALGNLDELLAKKLGQGN